jgi:ribosomal protein S20
MNKKQRNRKHVKQNQRNRLKNRRIRSTIKTSWKTYLEKCTNELINIGQSLLASDSSIIIKQKPLLFFYQQTWRSIDKALRHQIIHGNKAIRMKSRLNVVQAGYSEIFKNTIK